MSTSIIQFPYNNGQTSRVVSKGAVQLWFAITVPLTVLTLLIWSLVKFWETRQQDRKEMEAYTEKDGTSMQVV
jgi:heme/copper-type cytochrome/quinol oxidase subunit 2